MTRLTLERLINSLPDPKPALLPPPPDEIIVDLDETDAGYFGSPAWDAANAILRDYPHLDPMFVVDAVEDAFAAGSTHVEVLTVIVGVSRRDGG